MARRVTSGICVLFCLLAGLAPSVGATQPHADASAHPKLAYSTYFGTPADRINALAVGHDGSLYLAGVTLTNPERIDARRWTTGGGRPFVAHLAADGSRLLYFTHLSNGSFDEARAIAVDASGNAYVTGQTRDVSFQVRRALQARCRPDPAGKCLGEAFVAKLDPQGSLVFATYLGGSGEDAGNAIAIDRGENIYVAGSTHSPDFPVVHPAQPTMGGDQDAFVVKIAADGSHVIYATYLGGSGRDEARGIALDGAGNAYLTGKTESLDFPTRNALQSRCVMADRDSCAGEAFVSKLSADGTAVLYSTYLGGSGGDSGAAIAADAEGNVYLTGVTSSLDFPLARPSQPALAGTSNAFVTEISSEGSELPFSTYLGGSGSDQARAIAIDASGKLVVSGWTASEDFPMMDALQSSCRTATSVCSVDAFVSVLDANQRKLLFSSYLGGSRADVSQSVALDATGAAFVAGWTDSRDFPGTNGVPATRSRPANGSGGSFVAKFDALLNPAKTVTCGSGSDNWTGAAGDNQWTTGTNWSLDRVPISTDTACIASSFSGNTIAISRLSPTHQVIASLAAGAPLSFSTGPLTISGAASFAADLAITSGILTLSGSSSMTTLELSGGTLTGAGTLSLSGVLTWSAGAMCTVYSTSTESCSESPTQAITNANGGISFGSGNSTLDSRTLNNNVTATMASSSSLLNLLDEATVNNNPGATWNLVADARLTGPSGSVNNAGTFEKTAGTSTSTVQPVFNNTGTVMVNAAAVDFTGGGACNAACPGSWTVGPAGVLQFDTASFSLSGPVSGSGTVSFDSGFVNLTGGYGFTGTTNFNGAVVGFNQAGTATFAGPVNLANGYLYGTATLTLNSVLTWTYGVMCTSYSTTSSSCANTLTQAVTNANAGITFPFGYPTLNSRTLNSVKTSTMSGAGYFLSLLNNAIVNNKSGATWNLAADASLSGSGTFNNSGIFQKTAGTTISTVQPVFNNTGTVQANSATLDFAGGGSCVLSCSGSWTAAKGATLQFDSGVFVLSGPIGGTGSGAGTVVFSSGTETLTGTYNVSGGTAVSGAFVNFNGPLASVGGLTVASGVASFVSIPAVTVTVPTLTLSGGTIAGPDNLTVTGMLTWDGGAMCTVYLPLTQSCTTSLTQAVTSANGGITFGAGASVLDGRTLTNQQAATMANKGSSLTLADGAVVNNNPAATWNLSVDVGLGGTGTFNNLGTFKKTGGSRTSIIQPVFVSIGTVLANAATLSFSGSFTQKAGSTSLGGGTLSVSSPAVFSGGSLSGQGSFAGPISNVSGTVAPGSNTAVGKIYVTGTSGNYTQNSSGTFRVKIGGTSDGQFDVLSAGGAVTLNGSLTVSTINGFSPRSGDTFTFMRGASVVGQFSKVTSGWKVTYKTTSVVLTFQ
jgi:beta-propeller repeat-containing protein